jgi:hypothetical protein
MDATDSTPDPAGTQTTQTAEDTQPLLSLTNIGKNFGPVRVLMDINLDIPPGLVTAVVGDNGAGKSTLIKTISGIYQPDGGEIRWQGRQVHLHSPKAATDLGIATVYQDLALCDNLDIVANMFLGREETKRGQLDEIGMEKTAKQTLADLSVVTVRSVRQPVGRDAPGQAGYPGRTYRGSRRHPDPRGARPDKTPEEPEHRGDRHLAQPERCAVRRGPDRRAAAGPPGRRRAGRAV